MRVKKINLLFYYFLEREIIYFSYISTALILLSVKLKKINKYQCNQKKKIISVCLSIKNKVSLFPSILWSDSNLHKFDKIDCDWKSNYFPSIIVHRLQGELRLMINKKIKI